MHAEHILTRCTSQVWGALEAGLVVEGGFDIWPSGRGIGDTSYGGWGGCLRCLMRCRDWHEMRQNCLEIGGLMASGGQAPLEPVRSSELKVQALRAGTNLHLEVFICTPTFTSHPKCSSHLRFFIFHPSSSASYPVHLLASSSFYRISSV